MLKIMRTAGVVLGGLIMIALGGCGNGQAPNNAGGGAAPGGTSGAKDSSGAIAWNTIVDQYFDQVYFKFSPTLGTTSGLHQYDAMLEDYSRAGVDRNIAALH